MGDALTGTGVRDQPSGIDTADGELPVPSEPPAPVPSLAPTKPAVDYPALVAIDRRHYQIGNEIAHGGMGRVSEARDLRLGRNVAIKQLLPGNPDMVRRFEREARITARLQHPAIIQVYEAGLYNGDPFYVMKRVSGVSLDVVLKECNSLDDRLKLIPNVISVADALAYAHNQNIIHRDLKPANVLVGAYGETVVIDWGLAKDLGAAAPKGDSFDPQESLSMPRQPDDTNVGSIVGTYSYMPPEQAIDSKSVDRRADVYSLGALLYHVLVGQPPHRRRSQDGEQPNTEYPSVNDLERGAPADLVAVVEKAMAHDPEDRYPNAGELAKQLRNFQTGQLVDAHNYTRLELLWRGVKKHRVPVAIGVASIVALAVVATASVSRILHEQEKDQRRRNVLLEERGRTDLLAGLAGRALAGLVGAAHDGEPNVPRAFMIADAIRPFEAQVAQLDSGPRGTTAYSRDGTLFATTQPDGSIMVWRDGKPATALGAGQRATLVRFDNLGKRVIVAGADKVVRVYPVSGGQPIEFRGHTDRILDIDINPADDLLATASADGTARTWHLATGTQFHWQDCHGGNEATAVRFSPDNKVVVSAGNSHDACRWYPDSGLMISYIRGHKGKINTLRWHPQGGHVLTASDDGTARLWDAEGKPVVQSLVHEGNVPIASAEFSSDGTQVVTAGSDRIARVWELPELTGDISSKAREQPWKLVGHTGRLEHAVFDAEDRWIATVGRDGQAKVWDAETGQLLATFEHALAVHLVAFIPGSKLFTASDDGTTRVWDIARGAAKQSRTVDSPIHAIAIARDGTLAVGADDTRVRIWRDRAREPTVLRDHMGSVYAVAFASDGKRLVTAGEDAQAFVWDVTTSSRMHSLGGHSGAVRALAVSPDGKVIATGDGAGMMRLWSADTGAPLGRIFLGSAIMKLAFSPDGELLVAVGGDGFATAWRDGIPMRLAERDVTNVAFRPDGEALVVTTASEIAIHPVVNRTIATSSVTLDTPTGDVRAVAFTPDGALLVTAGVEGVVRVWDAAKGKLVGTREGGGTLNALAVSADGQTVWVGGDGNIVRAWDIGIETRPVRELAEFIALRVPWELDETDVVRPRRREASELLGGNRNGER